MWLDEAGPSFQIAWLPFEFVGQPLPAVVASLHDDFRPCSGHHGEEPVIIDAPKWRGSRVNAEQMSRPLHPQAKHRDELHSAHDEN